MPELPEVETVRRGLQKAVSGKTIQTVRLLRPNLRFPLPDHFTERLKGHRIERVERRAKYLLIYLDNGLVLLAHLGMTGHFRVLPAIPEALGKHDHVLFIFTDGGALVFNDPRRFGFMDLATASDVAAHKLLAQLGPEPLDKAFNANYLRDALTRRTGPIKPALMDQKLVVGVGNIYASEALYLAQLDPRMPAPKTAASADLLVDSIRSVLKSAIASGGSSLRDFIHTDGEMGYFQHRFFVYGRADKPCFTCGSAICQVQQAGRSTYFCPQCQCMPQRALKKAKKTRKSAALQGVKKAVLGA